MSSKAISLGVTWPGNVERILVSFSPTRTVVRHVTADSSLGVISMEPRPPGPRFTLTRDSSISEPVSAILRIEFFGEQPRNPLVESILGETYVNAPLDNRYRNLYEARVNLCRQEADPEQDYFCLLDSLTSPVFLEFAINDPEERRIRAEAVEHLGRVLSQRLERRFSGPRRELAMAGQPQSNSCVDDLARKAGNVSAAFREASQKLGGDSSKIGHAMERFAAGYLRRVLKLPELPHTEIVTEPDSSNVFYFAEFAFLCLDCRIDSQEWEALLPSLVAMQRLFCQRFSTGNPQDWCVRDYTFTPSRILEKATFQQIRREYNGNLSRAELEARYWDNLHALAKCF